MQMVQPLSHRAVQTLDLDILGPEWGFEVFALNVLDPEAPELVEGKICMTPIFGW